MAKSSGRKKRGVDALVNISALEGADYLKDMEMSSDRNKLYQFGDEGVRRDEKYASFVGDLEEYWDAEFVEDEDEDEDEGEDEDEDEDEEDPMYAMFLSKLTKHGNAYMLERSPEHGVYLPIMYEFEGKPRKVVKRRTQQKKITRKPMQSDRQGNFSQKNPSMVRNFGTYPSSAINRRTAGSYQGNSIPMNGLVDVKIEIEDSPMLVIPPSTASVATLANRMKLNACEKSLETEGEDFEVEIVQPVSREQLLESLREELHEILRKPYDQKEFDDLWELMNSRTMVETYRSSRNGGSYRPGDIGLSYLDRFPKLADEIEKVESDSQKVLNLLRMLSFYLKNVPNGIPVPWLDAYTMTILPGSAAS